MGRATEMGKDLGSAEHQPFERRQEQVAGAGAWSKQQLLRRRHSRLLTCDASVVKLHSLASLLKKMVLVTKVVVAALPLGSAERLCLSGCVFLILEASPLSI
jgi:hypothetical protein